MVSTSGALVRPLTLTTLSYTSLGQGAQKKAFTCHGPRRGASGEGAVVLYQLA